MRGRLVIAADASFILLGCSAKGAIESATFYRARPSDGKRAGEARALIAGLKNFRIYQAKTADNGDGLEFERVR
jgi:hypothetical protein